MDLFFAKADLIFDFIAQHGTLTIYLIVLVAMIVENIIPPFPGDTVIFVCGVYAAGGHASLVAIYFLSVIGTLMSVMLLYYLGRSKGRAAFQNPHARWLGIDKLNKVERWFGRWGNEILLFSRWLSGIRALLALFAGVGNVPVTRMFIYSLISTLTWNFAVLFLAVRLRHDWHKIDHILAVYGWFILIGTGIVILTVILRRRYLRNRSKAS